MAQIYDAVKPVLSVRADEILMMFIHVSKLIQFALKVVLLTVKCQIQVLEVLQAGKTSQNGRISHPSPPIRFCRTLT